MEMFNIGKKSLCNLLVMSFIISGCTPTEAPKSGQRSLNASGAKTAGTGNNAGPAGDTLGNGTSLPPKVEIRHLIEPNLSTDLTYSPGTGYAGGGSYVRKLTLPKNFQGRMYLAGINIGTLADRHVRVRFKFGVGREPIVIPATVTQAPGITPQTNINVLVMDMRGEPFRNVRLPYDLFDYNDYDFSAGDTPVQDNRNTGLYCRGLRVEDDPTFVGVGSCDGLQSTAGQPEEECLYSYAKVLDQGLVKVSGSVKVPLTPSLPQVKSVTGSNYYMDYMSEQLKRPLPDIIPTSGANTIGPFAFSQLAVPANVTDSIAATFSSFLPVSILGSTYYYYGPYRLVNKVEWQFKFSDLDGPKRLFRQNSWVNYPGYLTQPLPDDSNNTQNKIYYNSYLFPLATKLSLSAGYAHLSSGTVTGSRSEDILPTAGSTLWMDGANARAQSKNIDLEHLGSCNVSSTIEIIAKDNNDVDYVIAVSKEVKIQLVRPTRHLTDSGNEVLFTNFKTCSSNATCGGNECCFNNRCWDENLVSQCFDSSSVQGNRLIGDSCSTDLECTSLCCNRVSGQCAPHNTLLNPAVLCSKPSGDFCIAKEWCQKSTVVKCLVIKTGTTPTGNTTCRQHCYSVQEFGDCKNGVCVPPEQPAIPTFDPNDPSACDAAVPAPNF